MKCYAIFTNKPNLKSFESIRTRRFNSILCIFHTIYGYSPGKETVYLYSCAYTYIHNAYTVFYLHVLTSFFLIFILFYFHIFPLESAVVFLISFVLDFHISFFLQNGLFYYISNEMNGFVFLKKMKWYLESNLYDDRFKRKSFLFFSQFIFFHSFPFLSSAVFILDSLFSSSTIFYSTSTDINALLIFLMYNIETIDSLTVM